VIVFVEERREKNHLLGKLLTYFFAIFGAIYCFGSHNSKNHIKSISPRLFSSYANYFFQKGN
jgi:hypothetical protein